MGRIPFSGPFSGPFPGPNQLTSATYTTASGGHQPANESYSFDNNGNRTMTGYSTGSDNLLTSDGTFNYQHDADGNLVTRTQIASTYSIDYKTTYTWDYRNRLTDVENYDNNPGAPGLTKHVHFVYDVFDHLIATEVDPTGGGTYTQIAHYVLDVSPEIPLAGFPGTALAQPDLQFDGNGNLTQRNLVAPDPTGVDAVMAQGAVSSVTQGDVVTWMADDNLGTPRDEVDNAGTMVNHSVFSAFGQDIYDSSPSVAHWAGFAGGHVDTNTGLVNDYHRWYDPATGRWISADPAGFLSGDANLERYVGNGAPNWTDRNGLWQNPPFQPQNGINPGRPVPIPNPTQPTTVNKGGAPGWRPGQNIQQSWRYLRWWNQNRPHVFPLRPVRPTWPHFFRPVRPHVWGQWFDHGEGGTLGGGLFWGEKWGRCSFDKSAAARYRAGMPRIARIAPGGLVYHVLNRSVARLPLLQKPADFEAFERVLSETHQRHPTRILAYCLMPNHWHFVLWPRQDGELTNFVRWLTHTHTMRWHAHYHTSGTGHVYQGRFKAFPVETDEYFYSVARYVERNALRADLVSRAEDWRWSSLWRRRFGDVDAQALLSSWPLPCPRNWLSRVNACETEAELKALRTAVRRSSPFGSANWQQRIARRLGVEHALRPRGRPPKRAHDAEK